jgi:hypothetical protein
MINSALDILKFLPSRFKDKNEGEYINYLWECYESNYLSKKYQFSFIAYHMLFMSFVYFNIWQIKSVRKEDFDKLKLGFSDDFGNATNPFMYSTEGESRIFDLLKYLCASHSDVKALIGQYKRLVRERNDIAHANGNIPFRNVTYLETRVNDIIRYAGEIQQYSKPVIQECFEKFLIDSQDEELRQYFDLTEQINEVLIHEHYLSQKDLEFCLQYDITQLTEQPKYDEIEKIFEILKSEYAEAITT